MACLLYTSRGEQNAAGSRVQRILHGAGHACLAVEHGDGRRVQAVEMCIRDSIVDQELIDGFFKRYFPFEFLREPVDEQVFPVGFGPCVGDYADLPDLLYSFSVRFM